MGFSWDHKFIVNVFFISRYHSSSDLSSGNLYHQEKINLLFSNDNNRILSKQALFLLDQMVVVQKWVGLELHPVSLFSSAVTITWTWSETVNHRVWRSDVALGQIFSLNCTTALIQEALLFYYDSVSVHLSGSYNWIVFYFYNNMPEWKPPKMEFN